MLSFGFPGLNSSGVKLNFKLKNKTKRLLIAVVVYVTVSVICYILRDLCPLSLIRFVIYFTVTAVVSFVTHYLKLAGENKFLLYIGFFAGGLAAFPLMFLENPLLQKIFPLYLLLLGAGMLAGSDLKNFISRIKNFTAKSLIRARDHLQK